jgi:hypothetical protein
MQAGLVQPEATFLFTSLVGYCIKKKLKYIFINTVGYNYTELSECFSALFAELQRRGERSSV